MASDHLDSVVHSLQRLFGPGTVNALSGAELLERFLVRRDGAAFEAIFKRHGPMVLGVCRRVLDDLHDVDDAFQATFLILVKRARSIRDRDVLGTWLYGVARRVAVRAKSGARRRRSVERAPSRYRPGSGHGAGLRVGPHPIRAPSPRRRGDAGEPPGDRLPDEVLQNIYGVALSLGRREQLAMDSAGVKRALEAVNERDVRQIANEVFAPARPAAVFVSPAI
jgi:RNA polymerase sigma factor (sigma-70 family)